MFPQETNINSLQRLKTPLVKWLLKENIHPLKIGVKLSEEANSNRLRVQEIKEFMKII